MSFNKKMPFFYYVSRVLCRILIFLFSRSRVQGKENVPKNGALIVVANHLNNADPPLLSTVMPREMVFMAKEELFRNRMGRIFVSGFGAFPVSRRKYDREALRQAGEVLQKGLALGLFPEGSRSKTGGLQEAMQGSALIAFHFHSPILPVGIYGTEQIKGRFWFLRRPRVTINIGPIFHLPASSDQVRKEDLKIATDLIMNRIAELLPVAYHGVYSKNTERVN